MAKQRKKTYGHCLTPSCENRATNKGAQLCNCCYQFQHYWTGRSVTDKMKRVKRIAFWNERAQTMLMPANVSPLRGKATATQKRKAG